MCYICILPKRFSQIPDQYLLPVRKGVASRKQARGPQHNMLTIANANQDIETILK